MTAEHQNGRIIERLKGESQALWIQANLRDEIEKLHASSDRPSLMEHASKVYAFLSLVPKDYHSEIEIAPRLIQNLDKGIRKFSKKDIQTTATRLYLQIGVPLEGSQLTIGISAEDRPSFVLQEATSQALGIARKISVKDLISARVIRNQLRARLEVV